MNLPRVALATRREVPELDVVVVGGGVAGLTAARALTAASRRVLLLERSGQLGGRVRSVTIEGQVVEAGAAFVAPFYATTLALMEEVGVARLLTERSRPSYVVRDRGLHPLLPLPRLLAGRAVGGAAKLRLGRLAVDLAAHWRVLDMADLGRAERLDVTSAADYLRRRLGADNLQHFFGPLLRGMLYWDAGTTSYPVLLAILKAFATSGASQRMLGGLAQFPQALARGVPVQTGTAVRRVTREPSGHYLIEADAGGAGLAYRSRAVVCAVPAAEAAAIVPALPGEAQDYLRSVSYGPTAVLSLRVRAPSDSFPDGAVLFPVSVAPEIAAINAYLPPDSAAPGLVEDRLVHVYLSQDGFERYAGLPDDELAATVVGRITSVLGPVAWLGEARLGNVQRWEHALPRFGVGHVRRTRQFTDLQPALPGLAFAGDYLGGPYLDGAIRTGLAAARLVGAPAPA